MLNKKKLIIYGIRVFVGVFIILILGISIIIFFRTRIITIEKSLQENYQIIHRLERREETIAKLQKQFELIQSNDSKIQNAFPFSDDILGIIQSIDASAHQSGVIVTKQLGNPTPFITLSDGTIISNIPLSISIQGSASSVRNFLRTIESLPYFISISSLSMRASEDWNSPTTSSIIQGVLYTKERK